MPLDFQTYKEAIIALTKDLRDETREKFAEDMQLPPLVLIKKLMPSLKTKGEEKEPETREFIFSPIKDRQSRISEFLKQKFPQHSKAAEANPLRNILLLLELASADEGFQLSEEQEFSIADNLSKFFDDYKDVLKYIELNYNKAPNLLTLKDIFTSFRPLQQLPHEATTEKRAQWKALWKKFLLDPSHSREATEFMPYAWKILQRIPKQRELKQYGPDARDMPAQCQFNYV